MERVSKSEPKANVAKKVKYRKVGGGSLRLNNRIIPPGGTFEAYPEEIPAAFKDLVIPLEDVAQSIPVTTPVPKPTFTIKPVKPLEELESGEPYLVNVVSSTGKVLNENPMEEAIAKKLIEDISKS